jgi:hypothetical protein
VAELADEYQKLAAEIDALYAEREASAILHKLADRSREPSLARLLRAEAALVEAVSLPVQRLRVASHLMERIRRQASIAAAKDSPPGTQSCSSSPRPRDASDSPGWAMPRPPCTAPG